jgi:hypothetical protein
MPWEIQGITGQWNGYTGISSENGGRKSASMGRDLVATKNTFHFNLEGGKTMNHAKLEGTTNVL